MTRTLVTVGGQDVQSMGDYVEMLVKTENARRASFGWAPLGGKYLASFKQQAFQLCFRGRFEQANALKSADPILLQE